MRTVEQLLISPPSSFNKAEWGLLYLAGKVNGYWPKNSVFLRWLLKLLAPSFREAHARLHDFDYAKGTTEKDRIKADRRFCINLTKDSLQTRWFLPYYYTLSLVFYIAVRTMGSRYFNYK